MTLVTIPRATVPVTGSAPISPEWYRWAHDITQRVGGPTGAGSNDLALSQFEDAGIEEVKAKISQIHDELRMLPLPQPQSASTAGAAWTEVEIDFGSSPVYEYAFTITDASIAPTSKLQVLPCGKAATGRTADDWQWDGAVFAANPGAGAATCYATFMPGPVVGRRMVQYSVGA